MRFFFFPPTQSDVHNPLSVYLLFLSLSASILPAHPLSLSASLGEYVCVCVQPIVGGVVML